MEAMQLDMADVSCGFYASGCVPDNNAREPNICELVLVQVSLELVVIDVRLISVQVCSKAVRFILVSHPVYFVFHSTKLVPELHFTRFRGCWEFFLVMTSGSELLNVTWKQPWCTLPGMGDTAERCTYPVYTNLHTQILHILELMALTALSLRTVFVGTWRGWVNMLFFSSC
jgi:hypothetical protein